MKDPKVELNIQPRPVKRKRDNITFQLPKAEFQALENDAAVRGESSIHQRSREILIDYLHQRLREEVCHRLDALEREMLDTKEEIRHMEKLLRRLAFISIALSRGPESDDEQSKQSEMANGWVKQCMPTRE